MEPGPAGGPRDPKMRRLTKALFHMVAAASLVAAVFGLGLSGRDGMEALAPVCAGAASPHHATVVVTHLSGRPIPVRVCVAFDEDHISGSDLLNRSGIQWQSDAYLGQGTAVCQVDHEPQTPPRDSCLGHNNDPYWSIWTAPYGGSWTYAQRAITALVIHDGDAEGLRYQQPDGGGPPDPAGTSCPPPAPAATQPPRAGGSQPLATTASTPRGRTIGAGVAAGSPGDRSATATPGARPAMPTPNSVQALGSMPTVPTPDARGRELGIAGSAVRPFQWLGPAAAVVAGLALVGALLVQLVLPRLRR